METLLGILIGIGLSAACGFRVFVPLLVTGIAAKTGHLHLAAGFSWIQSYPALVAFSAASVLEIGGYYIPWLDHLLDTLSTPASIVAGTIITASMVTHMDPFLRWTLAVIAGGGMAATVQGVTVLGRGASTATTGGLGNPIFATLELGAALFTSILAIIAPLVVIAMIVLVLILAARKFLPRKVPVPAT